MISNFENITEELTNEELSVILPLLLTSFEKRSKSTAIKAPEIVSKINQYLLKRDIKLKLTEVKLRKFTNFIRKKGIIPLIATSNGYYVSYDKEEINKQISSLMERANSILDSARGLEKFLK